MLIEFLGMKKVLLCALFIVLMVISFNFGQRWELSKTASYCSSIGQTLSSSGAAYCVEKE